MRASAAPIDRAWYWTASSFVALCAATAWLYATRGWHRLGVPPIGPDRPPFSDAHAQLVTADACLAGAGTWIERVCFLPSIDVLPHAQSYEPWLSLSRLGLGHEHYIEIGWIMAVAFYLAACLLFRPGTAREAGLLVVLLLSPAVQLAVERANFDLLMATILILSGWLLSRRRMAASVLACALLALGTTLKIYSGLSTLFAWLASRGQDRWITAVVSAGACLFAILVLRVENIFVLFGGAPEGATRFSTGAQLTFDRYGAAGGALVVAVAFAACTWPSLGARGFRLGTIDARTRQAAVFTVSWLTAIPLFLLKDSYDYRFVLWLPMLALAMHVARDSEGTWRTHGRIMMASFVFSAYVEWACQLATSVSDGVLAAGIERMLVLGKHIGMWSLVFASSTLMLALVRPVRPAGLPSS
jgi:hypothetical protein